MCSPQGFGDFKCTSLEMCGRFGSCRIPDACSRECDRPQLIVQFDLRRCQSRVCAINSKACAHALAWFGGACGAGSHGSRTYYITGRIGCALIVVTKKTTWRGDSAGGLAAQCILPHHDTGAITPICPDSRIPDSGEFGNVYLNMVGDPPIQRACPNTSFESVLRKFWPRKTLLECLCQGRP